MINPKPYSLHKKLLFKIGQFPHLSETFVTAQIITAIKCGFEVSILVGEVLNFEASKQQQLLEKYNIPQKIIAEDFKIPKSKLLRLLGVFYLLPNLISNFRYFLAYIKHQKKLSLSWCYRFNFYSNFKDFDIVHIQYGTNRNPFDLFKKSGFYKSKLIVSFHGHDAFFPINGWIKNEGYYTNLFKYGDKIVANTPYLADKIEQLGCPTEKIDIIPVGVNTEFFKMKNQNRRLSNYFEIITVGRLDKVKGHKYSIEALKVLKEKGCKVHLTIIGEGAERNSLEQMITDLGLLKDVRLVGRKSQEEVKNYLLNSDLYIFTAVPVENDRRETQGLATLEAQACGLPVVAFDSGGVKYTFVDGVTGYICVEYDVNCIVTKIENLISDNEKLHKMGKAAVEFVSYNFSQKSIDYSWRQLYNTLNK